MAKRKPNKLDSRLVLDQSAFTIDDEAQRVWRAVSDDVAHQKLDIIADALGDGSSIDQQYAYSEITSVPSGSELTILSFVSPVGVATYLQRVSPSGSNIAEYKVKIDGNVVGKKRTYFGGSLNTEFIFDGKSNNGYPVPEGSVITVTVIHNRPSLGEFNSTLQVIQI